MNTADLFLWILDNLNYWVVTLFMAIESSFIPFPSEVVVPPAAWKAMDPDSGMSFILVIVFATIGANIGALIKLLFSQMGRPSYHLPFCRQPHRTYVPDRPPKGRSCRRVFPQAWSRINNLWALGTSCSPINQHSCRFVRYACRQILALYHYWCWHLEYSFSNHRLGYLPIYRL